MEKSILLDIAQESVRRHGALPALFAEKMARRLRRKFTAKVDPGLITELSLHYKEIYDFGTSVLKDYIKTHQDIYASPEHVDSENLQAKIRERYPEEDEDILRQITAYIIYYEYLR